MTTIETLSSLLTSAHHGLATAIAADNIGRLDNAEAYFYGDSDFDPHVQSCTESEVGTHASIVLVLSEAIGLATSGAAPDEIVVRLAQSCASKQRQASLIHVLTCLRHRSAAA
jgi:hypothetical protein